MDAETRYVKILNTILLVINSIFALGLLGVYYFVNEVRDISKTITTDGLAIITQSVFRTPYAYVINTIILLVVLFLLIKLSKQSVSTLIIYILLGPSLIFYYGLCNYIWILPILRMQPGFQQ